MNLGYKYRIYPSEEQQAKLASVFGVARFVYNWGLNERIEHYKAGKKFGYASLSREFTRLRNNPEYPWLKEVNRDVADRSLRNLESAYKKFFKTKKGFPNFKKKTNRQSATYRARDMAFTIKGGVFKVSRLGEINAVWSRKLPSKPTQVTISKTPSGKYYASFLIEVQEKKATKRTRSVGIDMGVKTFAVLSNGQEIENPKHFDSLRKKLAIQQRRLSKKQKGSNRYKVQRIRVAKVYEKISHKRADFLHKETRLLVRRFDRIFIEDLNVAGMVKNQNLARVISDASFGAFRRLLEYKAKLYGKQVIPVGRFFPSSKLCSDCGVKNDSLTLADRVWTCVCGSVHNRDLNASKNILAAGLAVIARGASNVNVLQ